MTTESATGAGPGWGIVAFLLYVFSLASFIFWAVRRSKVRPWNSPVNLPGLPEAAKAGITLLLLAYAQVHVLATYEAYLKSRVSFPSAEEYFEYMSLAKLVATSHAHLFGHGTMYVLTSALFLLTSLAPWVKTLFVCLALSSGLIDVWSWWMMKYYAGGWEVFAILAGVLYAVGWGTMAIRVFWELWFLKEGE